MLRNGPTFFPTTYNIPYPDYPSTSTFLIYLASLPFGKVITLSLILPTALTSALIATMTYQIGALQNRSWGWYGVFFTLFTASFLAESRTVALDQYVSLMTVTSFYLAYSANCLNKPKRLYWLPLLFILGFAFRGPIGLIVPTSVVCGYFLLENQFKRFFSIGFLSAFLLVLCFSILLGLAYLDGGQAFLDDVIRMQVSSRVRIVTENAWHAYFINCLPDYAIAYPLAILITLGLIPIWWQNLTQKKISPELKLVAMLVFWALIVLLGFSFANSKRNHYVLPMVPPLALICGYLFAAKEEMLNAYLRFIKKSLLALFSILPLLCAIAIAAAWYYAFRRHFPIEAPVIAAILLCLGLQIIAWSIRAFAKTSQWPVIATFATALAAFMTIHIMVLEPTLYSLNHSRNFVYQFEQTRHKTGAEVGFFQFGRDAGAIKFMCNLPPQEIANGVEPLFIDDINTVLSLDKKVYYITHPRIYAQLPDDIKSQLTVLGTAEIGHIDILIFAVTKQLGKNDVNSFR
jgi:hypothetical protein